MFSGDTEKGQRFGMGETVTYYTFLLHNSLDINTLHI